MVNGLLAFIFLHWCEIMEYCALNLLICAHILVFMETKYKNILWVLLGIGGLVILMILSRNEDETMIHSDRVDTVAIETNKKGFDYEGDIPKMGYVPVSPKRKPSEAFIGKRFHVCLEMVSHWPDGKLIKLGDGRGGVTFMEFMTNGHHHYLMFSQEICESDEIIK